MHGILTGILMLFAKIKRNDMIVKTALWIKEYNHFLKIIGGLFFVLAILFGIIWALGNNVEPIAFLFSVLSSLFLASPSIAEFILPSRKPIKNMDYSEILEFIKSSNPKFDWKFIRTQYAKEAFLKEDPRLRIRARDDDFGVHNDEFNESWANEYPDSRAVSYWHDLFYDGALIERFILVYVDGFRGNLPLPNINTLEVEPLAYKVAEIFDENNSLKTYMSKSGLIVKSYDPVVESDAVSRTDSPLIMQKKIKKMNINNIATLISSVFFKILFALIALVLLLLICSGKYNAYLSIGFLFISCYLHLLAAPRSKFKKYIYFVYLFILYEVTRSGKVIVLLISVVLPLNYQVGIFGNLSPGLIIWLAIIFSSLPPLMIYLMLPVTVLDDQEK